jgi:hypothetical protein
MTYQTGLGPACAVTADGTVAANTTVVYTIALGGAVGAATFTRSVNGGAPSVAAATAGTNTADGLTMTWGTGSNLVLGATYTWTNVPIVLNGHTQTLDHETLELEFVDVESTASMSVKTKRSGSTARTLTGLTDGYKRELNVYQITAAVGVNRLRVYWGDY